MKVKINNKLLEYRAIWFEGNVVRAIDQRKLPHNFEIFEARSYRDICYAIRNMVIRGAPLIGITACYAVLLETMNFKGSLNDLLKHLEVVIKELKSQRPTAVDIFNLLDKLMERIGEAKNISEAKAKCKEFVEYVVDKNLKECKKIGEFGSTLIEDGDRILTHCNAGALACVDYGTALAPIRFAHYQGKRIFVYVDETRPVLQGARLTAWELANEGIEHALIVDNAAGYFMQRGEIDLVIVGADRIASNGDFANKIGTYEKAVVAKENDIPFYVAAPLSTFDFNCKCGKEIKIEERNEKEVLYINNKRIAPNDTKAKNPAFDITPAKYVTAFITPLGIIKPKNLNKLEDRYEKF